MINCVNGGIDEEERRDVWSERECTKLPACLNETKFRVVDKEWDSSPEEIWFRLKIRVKYGHIVTLLHVATFHPFFQSPCFVPISIVPHFVLYVHSFACPSATFHLHHLLHFVHSFTHSQSQPFMDTHMTNVLKSKEANNMHIYIYIYIP